MRGSGCATRKIEPALFRLVVVCAVVMLFAPATPRTSWVNPDAGGLRHSAGWESVAAACGLVAIASVAAARLVQPPAALSAAAAIVALLAFAGATIAAGGHWRDAVSGTLDMRGYTTYPAPAALPVAVVALIGAGFALALAVAWLRTGDGGA